MSLEINNLAIDRHRAAIVRHDLSRPVRLALNAGLLQPNETFFDYGCGHGNDVQILREQGFQTAGYDPHYFPDQELKPAELVNLGFVLNVIERENERREALLKAWQLTRKVLVVAAQIWIGEPGKGHFAYNDGFVTTRNTFQKYYEQVELKKFIDGVVNVDAVPAGLGIYFVFRDEAQSEEFRASRFRSNRTSLPSVRFQLKNFDDYKPILQPLMDFVGERGRLPVIGELKNESAITKEFRTLARAFEVIKRSTNADEWQRISEKRAGDLLVYLALSRFQRRPKFTALPPVLQHDIRAFFGNYKNACDAGDKLLFSLGQSGVIGESCRKSTLGKLVGNALYVHVSAVSELSSILRIYESCASRTFGQSEQTTIVKFRADKPKVSYLYYPDFDADPHPALHSSMGANLSSLWVDYRDYSASENPPVLHRKETFVAPDYPLYDKFAKLTAQELKHGLLENSIRIGTKNGWQERLNEHGLNLRGHRLVRQKPLG